MGAKLEPKSIYETTSQVWYIILATMTIRTMTVNDHKSLIPFWKEHYFNNTMDELPSFTLFLDKNPDLSFIAEEAGEIVGTVLGSFDGRRGYIQKLVVHKGKRKQGIGRKLLETAIQKLLSLGVTYIPISSEPENVAFYEKMGFKRASGTAMNFSTTDKAWLAYKQKK